MSVDKLLAVSNKKENDGTPQVSVVDLCSWSFVTM